MKKVESEQKNKKLDKQQKNNERQLADAYRNAREKIKTDIAKLEGKDELKLWKLFQKDRLKGLLREVYKRLTEITGTVLSDSTKKMYEQSYILTNEAINEAIGDKVQFDKPSKKRVEEAVKNPYDKVGFLQRNKDNNKINTEKLRKEITTGIRRGKSYKDIAKEIDKRFDIGFGNAVRISRTEGHRAREKGNIDSITQAQELGIRIKKQWLTAKDERVRDTHTELDGVTIDINEKFEIDGYTASEPGGFGVASEDINCRCTLIAIID